MVDTVQVSPLHGAAVILIDEALNALTVRMYNQASNPAEYAVHVEALTHAQGTGSAFYDHINAQVNNAKDPWKAFSAAAAEAVRIHAQVLQTKINL